MARMTRETRLYAWAAPAYGSHSPADHTWITTYDNRTQQYRDAADVAAANEEYWFCWGDFRRNGGTPGNDTGCLGSQVADRDLAMCLVQPGTDCRVFPPARGTIFVYGVDGVCHQLANQVLYATAVSGKPLTVRRARYYRASVFIYGTYGLQHAAWLNRIAGCLPSLVAAGDRARDIRTDLGVSEMSHRQAELPDDFDTHARAELVDDQELLARLLTLKSEVQGFVARPTPGFVPPGAMALNSRNQHLLDQAAILLGHEKFERVFGFKPDETVDLVDPEMQR